MVGSGAFRTGPLTPSRVKRATGAVGLCVIKQSVAPFESLLGSQSLRARIAELPSSP